MPPAAPALEFAFEAQVRVAPAIEAGTLPAGRRRIIPILGGTVSGPRLAGTVVPGGADWQIVQPDGLTDLTARYTLQAEDGTFIGVVNRGLRHGPPEVMARLLAGERVDPALIYFRCTPVFEAPAGRHEWLARHIFLATGERHPDGVLIRFFVVT
ncbi:MAG: DUF3237 domain-containing protein [Rhodospirillales bacterium]|nr:DUF3237 domain-containing protein [Rhodospirillales bacterium]MDE2200718.1 DUF3237 domain-containing protein [Rhodospirillales bacterium]